MLSACRKGTESKEGQTADRQRREDGDRTTETGRDKAREQGRGKRNEEGKGGRDICHAYCTAKGCRGGKPALGGEAGGRGWTGETQRDVDRVCHAQCCANGMPYAYESHDACHVCAP